MAFVYEEIREEDKDWVDFSLFKDLQGNSFVVNKYSDWVVDKDNNMALVMIGYGGPARPEDGDYKLIRCSFYLQGKYICFYVCYSKIENPNKPYIVKWFDLFFGYNFDKSVEREFTPLIKDALIVYSRSFAYDEHDAIFEF